MALNLAQVKLRKVAAPQVTNSFTDDTDIEDHQNLMLDANNEEWEEAVQEFTFPTFYMEISKCDASALLLANIFRGIESGSITKDEINDFIPGRNPELLKQDYKKQLQNLTLRLENKMTEIDIKNGEGIFIKTSCRSPKDAPAVGDKLKQIFLERLDESSEKPSLDTKLDALLWAGVQCLKVTQASDAIDLLCSSDRIRVDMFVALNPELDREWKQNLVIRKWVDIEPDMEFRGFVYNQKFTALSQYNHQMVSKRLVEQKEIIGDRIVKFWEQEIAPRLQDHEKLKNYIVDFALTGNNFEKVWVVELNPFLTSTSPNLFSWVKDKEIIYKGPFEFRVREKSSPGVLGDMTSDWRAIIDSVP